MSIALAAELMPRATSQLVSILKFGEATMQIVQTSSLHNTHSPHLTSLKIYIYIHLCSAKNSYPTSNLEEEEEEER